MRLFVGIPIPPDIVARVGALAGALRPLAALKWTSLVDLHLTTLFIGEQHADERPAIERALAALLPRAPFSIAVRGVGWFPSSSARAPRVFWAGIDAPVGLADLARDTAHAVSSLGIPIEERPYTPHLTLARVPRSARLEALREALASRPPADFGAFAADRFFLYESRASDPSGRYHPLATFLFSPPLPPP